jgi:membrane-anchored glycerophosphoryl diester phosphodiesterase (GDPDase)
LNVLAVLAGCIALVIPGIWIACRLIVSVPAALIEQRGPSEALGRSWRLTKDHAGRAFVLLLIYIVISMAAALVFQVPFTIASIAYRNNFAMLQFWTALTQVGDTIINIVVSPILLIATSVFYFDLRVRKEGFDLQFMLDPTSERITPPGTGSVPSILS